LAVMKSSKMGLTRSIDVRVAPLRRSMTVNLAFVVTQRTRDKGLTELRLSGRKPHCGSSARTSRHRVRRVWGDGGGRHRTRGSGGSATVRGTLWLTEDRCGGTFVRVVRGQVDVRDFARRVTIRVKAGQSYFARTRR